MSKKTIIRFYNWKDWRFNVLAPQGLSGWLGSNKTQTSYLKAAAREAESELNEVWLLAATKNKVWRVSAWIKLRKRLPNEAASNAEYSTLVYYDVDASKVVGDLSSGDLCEIPAIDSILQQYGTSLGQQGNAGFEFTGVNGKAVFNAMRGISGMPFSAYMKRSLLEPPVIEGNAETVVVEQGKSKPNQVFSEVVDVPETAGLNSDLEDIRTDLESQAKIVDTDFCNNPGEDVDAIVKRRIGQGAFRKLLEYVCGATCCVSGLSNKRLLIASHIVPWSKASSTQKTDANNGLLLSVTWDALFDKGLISFSDDGILLCSDTLDDKSMKCLGISRDVRLCTELLTDQRRENLMWHRSKHGFEH
jgi:hypothetical protein